MKMTSILLVALASISFSSFCQSTEWIEKIFEDIRDKPGIANPDRLVSYYIEAGNFIGNDEGEELVVYKYFTNWEEGPRSILTVFDYDPQTQEWFVVDELDLLTTSQQIKNYIKPSWYRDLDGLRSGDFNGNGTDELLVGKRGGWITTFEFDGNEWKWKWSNYGDNSLPMSRKFNQIKEHLIGDYDGDGDDDLLYVSETNIGMLSYKWDNQGSFGYFEEKFVADENDGIWPYRNYLRSGDLDGNGDDEILGLNSWVTVFDYDALNQEFDWKYSDYGTGDIDGYNYVNQTSYLSYESPTPFQGNVEIINIDYTDNKEELLFFPSVRKQLGYVNGHGGIDHESYSSPLSFELSPNLKSITNNGIQTGIEFTTYDEDDFYLGQFSIMYTTIEYVYPIEGEPAHLLLADFPKHGYNTVIKELIPQFSFNNAKQGVSENEETAIQINKLNHAIQVSSESLLNASIVTVDGVKVWDNQGANSYSIELDKLPKGLLIVNAYDQQGNMETKKIYH